MTDRVSTWRRVRINLDLTNAGPPAWSVFVEDTKRGVPSSHVLAASAKLDLPTLTRPEELPAVLRSLADRLEGLH